MEHSLDDKVKSLMDKGVEIPNPFSIDIGEDVDLDRISSDDVVIYTGCKIYGSKTLIMHNARLGHEGPVTIQDCQVGPHVELKGGFFKKSVFLEKATMAFGAHVRDACILEEEAGGAHTVGLKQTILLPFVTLGSLINFCDCLMAGGTSRKDHSEVGSSYIHFNYTPNQDKATPSLIGDVPRGVMLNQRPIFLGGQGGLVGPARIGFGTVIAAGTVFRGDCPEGGKLIYQEIYKDDIRPFYPGVYWEIRRRTMNNINYIANLIALKQWYHFVRSMFLGSDPMGKGLLEGALEKLDMAIDERIKRLAAIVKKIPESIKEYKRIMKSDASSELIHQKEGLFGVWEEIEESLHSLRSVSGDSALRYPFLEMVSKEIHNKAGDYISLIQGLHPDCRDQGVRWLDNIVQEVNGKIFEKLPSFKLV